MYKIIHFPGNNDCNYTLTCELCNKENKTLQSLYTHVIVHIRVELERSVKDLMELEGFQCKVCNKTFKSKAPLLQHLGCKHGKVNYVLRERGASMLPCLVLTNRTISAGAQNRKVSTK